MVAFSKLVNNEQIKNWLRDNADQKRVVNLNYEHSDYIWILQSKFVLEKRT